LATRSPGRAMTAPEQYRLLVEGELAQDRAALIGATEMNADQGRTELLVEVSRPAELHDLLRRICDLNLHLVAMVRIDDGEETS
jgi:hypothetical protein